jgi:hypothetical protein
MEPPPRKTPPRPRSRNRPYLVLVRITRKILIVFYLCLGVALVATSYLVWKNNDLIPAIPGVALFLFAGFSFIANGVWALRKEIRKGKGGP